MVVPHWWVGSTTSSLHWSHVGQPTLAMQSSAGFPPQGLVPLPVQALVTGRSISVMTGSFVDDFMTAAPTICLSTVEDFVTAAPTSVGDLESSAPTLVRDCANTEDFDFEDSDTATEEDTELNFDSNSDSCSSEAEDSSDGYPSVEGYPEASYQGLQKFPAESYQMEGERCLPQGAATKSYAEQVDFVSLELKFV